MIHTVCAAELLGLCLPACLPLYLLVHALILPSRFNAVTSCMPGTGDLLKMNLTTLYLRVYYLQ
jgi:hypothetical protein